MAYSRCTPSHRGFCSNCGGAPSESGVMQRGVNVPRVLVFCPRVRCLSKGMLRTWEVEVLRVGTLRFLVTYRVDHGP